MTNEHPRMAELLPGRDGLVIREVGEEVLVLDSQTDQIHQLNESAAAIWRKVVRGASKDEVVEYLATRFDVSEDTARRDVETTLHQLAELNLLVPGP